MDDPATDRRPPDHASSRKLPQNDVRSSAALPTSDTAPSICRICRGESTATEPLFYPCKCSGSIKFVHQDCLMEWLSHSQKKYCELCKTSFRFTKLYAPDMPKSLPVHVFVEHMARTLLRNLLVWLRAIVTISVWACWLPYFMRSVWSFMFWVSDEGLGSGSILSRANETDADAWWFSSSVADVGTCPTSPLLATTTTSAAEAAAMLQGLDGEDLSEYLVRILLGSLGMPMKVGRSAEVRLPLDAANTSAWGNGSLSAATTPSSLLGDVDFLRNLTRSPTLNQTVVTVLEGQVITVLVIVCFILVILVRDYVVQQQPEINMRAAFDEPENEIPHGGHEHVHQAAAAEPLPEPQGPESDDDAQDDLRDSVDQQAEPLGSEAVHINEMEVTGARQTIAADQPLQAEAGPSYQVSSDQLDTDAAGNSDRLAAVDGDKPDDRIGAIDYRRIQRRADVDEGIMVEEEGPEDKPGNAVDATHGSTTKRQDLAQSSGTDQSTGTGQIMYSAAVDEAGSIAETLRPSHSDPEFSIPASEGKVFKGKEKVWRPASPHCISETSQQAGSSRPRAASDGPHPQSSANPLGSNNWSFAGLPTVDHTEASDPRWSQRSSGNAAIPSPSGNDLQADLSTTNPASRPSDLIEAQHSDDETVDALLHRVPELEEDNPVEESTVRDDAEPAGLVGRVTQFMWGDLEDHQDAHLVDEDAVGEDDAEDDPWVDVPMADGLDDNVDADMADVDGVVAGAGLDPEAMDDLEDFEGVMELIGMRGPIAGLFQNAIFCAVLVSVTVFACIFIPYNIGRVSVWVVANPIQLVRMLLEFSKVVQDAVIMFGGLSSWFVLNLLDIFTGLVGGALGGMVVSARKASWGLWTGAGTRVMEYALMDFPISASEMQNFSAISHEALLSVKGSVASAVGTLDACFASLITAPLRFFDGKLLHTVASAAKSVPRNLEAALMLVLDPGSWVIDLSGAEVRAPVDPSLAYWPGLDRFWAILAGYLTIFAISAMYLRRGTPFARGNMLQAWEAGVIDTLHQASGIMKVIVIISIEMLVFPLYCGLLLDAALLPLFEDTTIKSRILFTYNFPLTSVFVHWFVGTGYMFHFALFVSMCRKIMRPGVLYFIRDPDDPEFHPIRDVLERSLTTQLRKILFSAFVYGALVIVCLGGVVWCLSYSMPGVLPIHYSSNEPVLEFPVDLLFYNFLMPQAVKVLKPGDGLHTMYTWWFRKCARGLRLTYFLFGERRIDEEGTLQLRPDSPNRQSRYKSLLLELSEHNEVVPKTWRDTFEGGNAKPNPALSNREEHALRRRKRQLVTSGQLVRSGRFVRAPASDRVKIPKGKQVFLHVSELGRRKDGNADNDIYASGQYQMVYIPPNFRLRIFLFILFIWLFAAVTGVGITIAPLALGRKMFKVLIPEHIRTNDIYAFSIGIYVLGTASYSVFCMQRILAGVRGWINRAWAEVLRGHAHRHVLSGLARGGKLVYAYVFLLVVFPLLFSTLMELYITIPLHTYMDPPKAASASAASTAKQAGDAGRHTVRVIQAWTLGLLYLNLGTRMISSLFPESRPALAVRTVMRRGWLRPDIGILTRAFVIPGLAVATVAMFGPPLMASLLIRLDVFGTQAGAPVAMIYRHSYPAAALAAALARHAIGMATVFKGWKAGIRDEAYLIGERLHNFGATTAGVRKAKRAWGAGRSRL